MKRLWVATIFCCAFLLIFGAAISRAEDNQAIDRLISKLPPPEKLVKKGANYDPADQDPLGKQLLTELKHRHPEKALLYARQLSQKYPKSLGVAWIHGLLAFLVQKMPEAMDGFRATIALDPKFLPAYAGLAAVQTSENKLSDALVTYQKITRLDPKVELGWLGSSHCADRLGKREQSLTYARQATVVAPSSYMAWWQLARAEKLSGHDAAAKKALAKSNQLRRSNKRAASNAPETTPVAKRDQAVLQDLQRH